MWEMFLVVLVRKDDHPFVRGVRSSSIAMGVMGVVGNKGGLLLEFSIYDHTFSIMNCHLLSGALKGEKRNDQMGSIMKLINPSKFKFEPDAVSDFSLILGDLNYRFKSTFSDYIASV
jgi:inositol polyphosphate 5-phosphatase INPP5B/F